MPHSQPAPARKLPAQPNLAQLRKQAKELLKAFRAGRAEAHAEVARFGRGEDPAAFALAGAQLVLARAYGFSSWSALKDHVDGANFAALLAAAEAGDLAAVRRLAGARPDLINPDLAEFRDSALHRAVLRRDEELTRLLMQLGADARTGIWPHRDATSARAIAVDREYGEIVAIIEREEEIRRARLGREGMSAGAEVAALQRAIAEGRNAEAIGLMEADPALIGACDIDGITPLHLAAWMHDPAMVGWLLDRGASPGALALCADPVQRDAARSGKTPLDFAAIVAGRVPRGGGRIFPFMENASVDPARFRETALLLLRQGAELTPRAAVALGRRAAVLRLHREGRLADEIHLFRGGLLAIAARMNRLDMVAALLDLGLDPDESVITDDGERSWGMPLWFATMCGRHEIAELLLARGADANAIVYACGDSLGRAAGDERMKALLLGHGARITVEQLPDGEEGRETAKAILAGSMPASSLNVANPARADLAEQMLWASGDPEIVRLCLPLIARPRDDPWWNCVLIRAGEPDKLKLILDRGIDPDARGGEGFTALHHLASGDCRAPSEGARLIRATMLLDAGASLAVRDSLLKSTPLGWACRWGRAALVQLYLGRGADPLEPDAEPWATPLAWARTRGHAEIAGLLRARCP